MTGTGHARHGDDVHAALSRGDGHGMGELAVDALSVDASFARDHEIGTDQPRVESNSIENEQRTGDQPRIEERDEPCTETSRGAGTWDTSNVRQRSLDDVGKTSRPLEARADSGVAHFSS